MKQVPLEPAKGSLIANKAMGEQFCEILQKQGRDVEDGGERQHERH